MRFAAVVGTVCILLSLVGTYQLGTTIGEAKQRDRETAVSISYPYGTRPMEFRECMQGRGSVTDANGMGISARQFVNDDICTETLYRIAASE